MSKLDVAEIDLVIGGTTHRLAPPTPRLAFAVSRKVGGIGGALARVQAGDLDVYFALLREAWPDAPKDEGALQEVIFANLVPVHRACVELVWSLQNGGRPLTPADVGDEPDKAPSAEGNARPAKAKA